MGIRGILRFLRTGLGPVIKLTDANKRTFVVARMYIDMIQFVYKALDAIKAAALMKNETPILTDSVVISKTVQIVLGYIREVAPREFLGIYFDGIPPLAKVVEQRARRYEMEYDPTSFNPAKNTVGTAFLHNVVEELMKGLAENASILPPDVELSTPAEKGEGEHKLANRIRDKDASLPGVKVIMSDDGDVMIMTLLNNWKDCYVYLDHKSPTVSHGLLNMGAVAERVRWRMGDTPTAVFDFCLLVILTGGNDFMPTILSARDRRSILTDLMDLYKSVLRGQPLMTNQGKEIVWSSVRTLINQLSTNEERNLREVANFVAKDSDGKIPVLLTRSMDPKTGEIKLPLFRKAWDDEIYAPKVSQSQLPESIIVPRPTQREIDADHTNSAKLYLEGLSWTLTYMKTGDGPDWYYDSAFPPLFGDIARLMTTPGFDPTRGLRSQPPWEPQNLAVYLLTVLPRRSAQDLFGETFANAFGRGAGLADLFPEKFSHFTPIELDLKMNKGRAILPPLNLDRLAKVTEEKLDINVIERNLKSLEPRVKFSHSQGKWTSSTTARKEETSSSSRHQPCAGVADYQILDVIIPSFS